MRLKHFHVVENSNDAVAWRLHLVTTSFQDAEEFALDLTHDIGKTIDIIACDAKRCSEILRREGGRVMPS